MQYDPELGEKVHRHLEELGVETPLLPLPAEARTPIKRRQEIIEGKICDILDLLGLDILDDSLAETGKRVAKMFCYEVFEGLDYAKFPKCTAIENKMGHDEIVLVRNNVIRSTCEHHLQPIYGRVHVGYIPDKKVIGLSKLNRVSDFFASRPQVQERLSEQIWHALNYILETEDIAVVIEAEHFCMKMRGVEDSCADTVTSKMGGRFRTNEAARLELMSLIRR